MAAAPTLDIHNHAVPKGLLDRARREGSRFGVSVDQLPNGQQRLFLSKTSQLVSNPELTDRDVRRQELQEAGVDLILESVLPSVLYYEATDEAAATWWSRSVNEAIHEDVQASSGRAFGAAQLPMQFPKLAVRELERAAREYGFAAAQIGSNVQGTYLDEPALEPIWEAAEGLGVLVFVHAQAMNVAGAERLQNYHLRNLIGNPLDVSIATASIIFGGVLDRYPRLKLVFSHAGGYAPWIRGRWRRGQQVREETHARGANRSIDDYLRQVHFDTVIHDDLALRYMIDALGAGQVLLGTDYPADMADVSQVPRIRALPGLSQDNQEAILGATALRLIGPEASAPA